DGQAGALRRRPQPVNGPVRRPLTLVWGREREAAAEHPRALLPRLHQGTTLGLVEREVAEDCEPIGVLARGLDGQLVCVRIPRCVWGEQGGIDPAGVHFLERVVLQVGGHLPVSGAGWVPRIPEVDLRVDDQHVLYYIEGAASDRTWACRASQSSTHRA